MENFEFEEALTIAESLDPKVIESLKGLQKVEVDTKPKKIIFIISEEDHRLVKNFAAHKKMSMTKFIIKALAREIRREIDLIGGKL